jgi:hypothetical protein
MSEALWEWGGEEALETLQNLAKPKRNPSEDLANNTLLAPGLRAVSTLLAGFGVARSAGVGAVEHTREDEAGAKVPPWLANTAPHSIAGTDATD